jgi:hypothetical protein
VATATASSPQASPVFREGLIARAIAWFSGSVGYTIKLLLLGATNALAVWALVVLIQHHRWVAVVAVAISTALIDYVYLVPHDWTLPAKFLIPGTVFLIGFQIIPILFTLDVAFSNYSTGHVLAKNQAIQAIQINSLQPPDNGRQFDLAPARDSSGKLVLLLRDEASKKLYVGTTKALTPLAAGAVTFDENGAATAAEGLHAGQGRGPFRPRPATPDVPRPHDRGRVDPAAGHSRRGRAEADPALRLGEERIRPDLRRQGLP